MSDTSSRAALPATHVTYQVTHYHPADFWVARIHVTSSSAEGDTVPQGELRREFGPFDDSTTVAQWICQQVHAYTKTQRAETITPPSDPPQGRQLPDSQ